MIGGRSEDIRRFIHTKINQAWLEVLRGVVWCDVVGCGVV